MWTDITFLLYVVLSVVSFYGFVLFLWWWGKTHRFKVGPVYAYVTFLLLGLFISHSTGAYVRWYRFVECDYYLELVSEWWWPVRLVLLLFCTILLVGHMSWRAFVVKDKE